jgi:hypothetical protein
MRNDMLDTTKELQTCSAFRFAWINSEASATHQHGAQLHTFMADNSAHHLLTPAAHATLWAEPS